MGENLIEFGQPYRRLHKETLCTVYDRTAGMSDTRFYDRGLREHGGKPVKLETAKQQVPGVDWNGKDWNQVFPTAVGAVLADEADGAVGLAV